MHRAAENGDLSTLRELMRSGADINSRAGAKHDPWRDTPLILAAQHGHTGTLS